MRRLVRRAIPLLGLCCVIGCAPLWGEGCGSPPRATDASFYGVSLQSHAPPCGGGNQVPRGSDPSVILMINCGGESEPFLAAVKIDGRLFSMVEVTGGGYSPTVSVDAGRWDAPDTLWHDVEVVIDPLNLFVEIDESNNRGTGQIRLVDPDVGIQQAYITEANGYQSVSTVPLGTPVDVHLRIAFAGGYEAVERSVRSAGVWSVADTVGFTGCAYPSPTEPSEFVRRWTPPAPGDYDVDFRIEPVRPTTDRIPSNNLQTRRLTVTPPGPAAAAGLLR